MVKVANRRFKRVARGILRWMLRIIAGFIILLLLVMLVLQFPSVQTALVHKVTGAIADRTGTEIGIDRVGIRFPKAISVRGVFAEDLQGDTLIYAEELQLDVRLTALFRNHVDVRRLQLSGITVNMTRLQPDSLFNYAAFLEKISGNREVQIEDGKAEREKDDAPASWSYDVRKVELDRIRFRFADHFSGIDIRVGLDGFRTSLSELNPDSMRFKTGTTRLGDVSVMVKTFERSVPAEPPALNDEAVSPEISVRHLLADRISFEYEDENGFSLLTQMKSLDLIPDLIDLKKANFALERLLIDEWITEISQPGGTTSEPGEDQAGYSGGQPEDPFLFRWDEIIPVNVRADLIHLVGISFSMQELPASADPGSNGPEPVISGFSDAEIILQDLMASPDTLAMNLKHLAGKESDGFVLRNLSAGIALGADSRLENISLETGESFLKGSLHTSLSLLMLPSRIPGDHSLNVNFPAGRAGADLFSFFPEFTSLLKDDVPSPLDFGLVARGRVNDFSLDTLYAGMPAVFDARLQGNVRGLPDPEQLFADIHGVFLEADPGSFLAHLPDSLHPEGIQMPGDFQLTGAFRGSPADFSAEAEIRMDLANVSGGMHYRQENERPLWDASLKLISEQPLAVIGQGEMVRDISAAFSASGKGFEPATMDLDLEGRIDSLWYNNYVYRDLELYAGAEEGRIQFRMDYEDEHLAFNLANDLTIGDASQSVMLDFELAHLNAQELGLTDEMVAVRTHLVADFDLLQGDDFPLGFLRLEDTSVLLDREVFSLDSLHISSERVDDQYLLDISSPLINGEYRGNISPASAPGAVIDHLGTYLQEDPERENAAFRMSFSMHPSPYISELLLPGMTSYEPFGMVAEFDGRERIFLVDAEIPEMEIFGFHLRDFTARVDSDPDGLGFRVGLPYLETGNLRLSNIRLGGNVRDQELGFELSFDDRHADNWLGLSGRAWQKDTLTEITFDPDAVINRREWQIEPDNLIRYGNSVLLVHNLQMRHEDKLFALKSLDPEDPGTPQELIMENINLGAFDLIGDEPLVTGLLNGHITVSDLFERPTFTAGLSLEEMGFGEDIIGDLNLDVVSPDPGLFEVSASVSGYDNRLDIKGNYRTNEDPHLDFQLELANLELSSIEPLTSEELTNMQGNISGRLAVSGNPSDPEIRGDIEFQEAGFHVAFLNVAYTIPEETIVFDRQRVSFDRFSLFDPSNREAVLDGHVDFSSINDIRFNLSLSSRNFLVLDLPRGVNEMFFGRLLLDTDLRLTSTLAEPVIEGQLSLNQGSTFAFIVPQTDPEAIGDAGIVEFVAFYEGVFDELVERELESEPIMAPFQNLDLAVNVEIDPQTRVRIILDEVAGDELEARGGGQITYGIDPGGRINLAGRYELTGGSYQLTFHDIVRRNFQIQRGGHIIWTGDPLEAEIDITAVYTIRTSPAELMLSHSTEQPDQARRRQYPFEVHLNMEGALMQPEISFEIRLPQEHRGAMEGRLQARLNELNQTESELNKQVFALLIMGNFIQDDPLAAVGAGPGLTSTARTSASSILSQQLNRLSDRYVRGVDISFDLTSYEVYENGQVAGRTELEMEVSRDFLDERLRITAGGNIELEDETRRQVNPSDIAGDFSVEYMLTPDGRFILRGYRERQYQDIYDGELVETGLSLIFRQTYNTFRELFMRREEELNLPDNNE